LPTAVRACRLFDTLVVITRFTLPLYAHHVCPGAVITLPAGAVAKYCDDHVCVCLSVCLSVLENISLNHTRDLYQIF